MNNHQNTIFRQIKNRLKTPLALLGVYLKNFQFNKTCHFTNHPYLYKGLNKFFLIWLLTPFFAFALSIPDLQPIESPDEKKRGREFLQLIWGTGGVITDIEAMTYLKKLGHTLVTYSENPNKHFDFFFLKNDSINAFAGAYGYIGVHTGMLLSSDTEAELAGVLAHEISHVTQNHLARYAKKASKNNYLMLAGVLAAALVDNNKASEAIFSTTIAGVLQQGINFTREHEWEADRIGTAMLKKSGFDPQGMANFFKKLKDGANAQEFLQSHPLSINRIADSMQRSARSEKGNRKDSFEYAVIKAKLHYQSKRKTKPKKDPAIIKYMQAYQAFEKGEYANAKKYADKLLRINDTKPSYILAGRIASKMGNVKLSQQYFAKNRVIEEDEPSLYYSAKAYLDNHQYRAGIAVLKPFLRINQGSYKSYKLLALLYIKQGNEGRSHIQSAKALVVQGELDKAIGHYERAKTLVASQDLYDIITVKINALQQTIDLF